MSESQDLLLFVDALEYDEGTPFKDANGQTIGRIKGPAEGGGVLVEIDEEHAQEFKERFISGPLAFSVGCTIQEDS